MAMGDRKIYRSKAKRVVNGPVKQTLVAVKSLTGEIIIKSFTHRSEAVAYADHAKRLGCEILLGWGE